MTALAHPLSAAPRVDRAVLVAVGCALAWLACQVALIVSALGGHFSYTLDDPYIHLALADEIARGHYGLGGVPASPSSSVLFPLLLAGLSFLETGQFAPLLINAAATAASAVLMLAMLRECRPIGRLGPVAVAALVSVGLIGLNLVGLAMTGMEHSLHVALTLAWVLGAARFLRRGDAARWWWAAALLEPLVRFEGATLWVATVLLLAWHGRRGSALLLLAAGAAALGGFSLFLHLQGLPILPSSVLVKSGATSDGRLIPDSGAIGHLVFTVASNLGARNVTTLLAAMGALALLALRRRASARDPDAAIVQLASVALAASAAHLVLGRFDASARYEIYVLALDAAVLLLGIAPELRAFVAARPAFRLSLYAALALLFFDYAAHSLRSDVAAAEIYGQQHQMHRMAADLYQGPVAVNDLGQVSYGNPYPVLDLWGLGSEEARLARRSDPSGRWMGDLVRRHGVGLAMIYEGWLPHRPRGWIPMARMRLPAEAVAAGDRTVTFLATAPDYVPSIRAALDRLGASLPPGVTLERMDGDREAGRLDRGAVEAQR